MNRYKIIIEELVCGEFLISANSRADAYTKALEAYKKSMIVLEPGEVQNMKITVFEEDGQCD